MAAEIKRAHKGLKWIMFFLMAITALFWWSPWENMPNSISTPAFRVLECGADYGESNRGNYDFLPGRAKYVRLAVPPGKCWTKWQKKSGSYGRFGVAVSDEIILQWAFSDGSFTDPHTTNPLIERRIRKQGARLTAVRFKNYGPDTVKILLTLQ